MFWQLLQKIKEWMWCHRDVCAIIFFIFGFIFIRSLHFSAALNFSTDQGVFSLRAWELWQKKEITLVGPTASFNFAGHFLLQSSMIFYTTLIFLLPARFDPITASWLFVLFAGVMCWPLYEGMKLLAGRSAAFFVTAIYAFFPFYVDYTRFLWNPNYQIALTPLLIFSLGKYVSTRKNLWLILSGIAAGFLFLFHYQFILVLVGITFCLAIFSRKNKIAVLGTWILGMAIGYSPMIAFEVRSHFYMTQTILLLLSHRNEIFSGGKSTPAPHYGLALSFVLLVGVAVVLARKLPQLFSRSTVLFCTALLLCMSLFLYLPPPTHAFGMPDHWNYLLEKKAFDIIAAQKLENFAVANDLYETKASVQYYLLHTADINGVTDDYYHNHFLFVITKKDKTDFAQNPAYEIQTFTPAHIKQEWELSPFTSLYLLERK